MRIDEDDSTRLVPNPAKKKAHIQVLCARAHYERALAATDAALLEAVTPPTSQAVPITNADHDRLTADLREAAAALTAAQGAHRAAAARLALAKVNPGQQVLDIPTKLISHAIRIAAFNTATTLARDVRVHTGYVRANHDAYPYPPSVDQQRRHRPPRRRPDRQARPLTNTAGHHRHRTQLCEHLTATQTCYPGTDLILGYEDKTHPDHPRTFQPCRES